MVVQSFRERKSKSPVLAIYFVGLLPWVAASWAQQPSPEVVLSGPAEAAASLRSAEEGFAAAFAARDREAFASFLDEHATFAGGAEPLRGKDAVMAVWGAYLEPAEAPFSWHPTQALVDDAGTLGMTSGPVYGTDGSQVGAFASVWRRQADGSWRIVFDAGPPCPRCQE